MTARALFFIAAADGTERLRAPWRIGGFLLVSLLLLALATTVTASVEPRSLAGAVAWSSGAAVLALAAAHFVMVRVVEDLPWSAVWLGAHGGGLAPRTLGWGVAVGAAAIAVPGAALLAAGWLEPVPAPGGTVDAVRYGLIMLAVLLPAAAWEELLFRGYILLALRDALGAWPAVLITAVAFGVAHAGNLASVPLLALLLVTLAGVLLGWIVLARRSLYAAIAAHLAWNGVLVAAMHTEVSGTRMAAPPAYRVVDAGPDWATGGPWGPEGGLAAGAGLTAALLITLSRRSSREER